MTELGEVLKEEWRKLDINKFNKLIESMPNGVKAVINSKGFPTPY